MYCGKTGWRISCRFHHMCCVVVWGISAVERKTEWKLKTMCEQYAIIQQMHVLHYPGDCVVYVLCAFDSILYNPPVYKNEHITYVPGECDVYASKYIVQNTIIHPNVVVLVGWTCCEFLSEEGLWHLYIKQPESDFVDENCVFHTTRLEQGEIIKRRSWWVPGFSLEKCSFISTRWLGTVF